MNNTQKEKRLTIARRILLFWTLFIGLGAMAGGICMVASPSGSLMHMEPLLPYFQVLPFADVLFQNFLFPGFMLILVNGITNLTAFTFLLFRKKAGYVLGTVFGFTLMAWIVIQFVIFPPNFMSIIYFFFGFLQAADGFACLIFRKQNLFKEEPAPSFDEKSGTIVLYFSRMGYSRSIAFRLASKEKAAVEEFLTDEPTTGTAGFWWCGRFGFHRWGMKIKSLQHDLSSFSKIIVVTPLWVFRMASPVRSFVKENQETLKQKETTIVFNHFMLRLPKGAVKELHSFLPSAKVKSFCTRCGVSKEVKESV